MESKLTYTNRNIERAAIQQHLVQGMRREQQTLVGGVNSELFCQRVQGMRREQETTTQNIYILHRISAATRWYNLMLLEAAWSERGPGNDRIWFH